jgi:hypothetical protein
MRKFNFLIPTERFAIALRILKQRSHPHISKSDRTLHSQKRFLRSASLSHSPHPQQAIPTERFAIAFPTSSTSDSYGALRYRIPKSPKSDSYGALRYRTPQIPKTAIPTERFAIALPKSPKAIPFDDNIIL